MKWKIILALFSLLCLALAYELMAGETVEAMSNNDKKKLVKILKTAKLTATNKIKAIRQLNIDDAGLNRILNNKTKKGEPVSDMQKVLELMRYV